MFQETPNESGLLTSSAKYLEGIEMMIRRSRARLLLLDRRSLSSPGAFPMPPNRDIVKAELVPPPVKHRLIETQDSVFRDAGRRRREFSQPIVDQNALALIVDARQQMPQCKCIGFASLAEHSCQIRRTLLRSVLKIESR